jgi:TolA-binding protein
MKRLSRLQARLPEDLQGEFEKALGQLQAAVEAGRSEHQTMADQIAAHQASIEELQQRTDELGQANANQARLISALTQTGEVPGAPIIRPTGRPFPTIEPNGGPTPAPSNGPSPSPSPSNGPTPSPTPPPPSATPQSIAQAFQQAFQALQTAAGTPGPTIRSMDVQVKGLVQVTDDGAKTTMQFPTADHPLTGDVLSTVSMSLGAVPELIPSRPPS